MSNVSQINSMDERKERRRLHLREIMQEQETEAPVVESANDETVVPEAPKEKVGVVLRAAREARNEDAAKVASALKMRREQLQAIEDNDLERLPGRAYTVGFVRSYARYLNLDAETLVQRFKDENAAEPLVQPVEHVFPEATTAEPRFVPSGSILIWALLIAMVVYAISYLTLPSRKTSPTATAANAEESSVVIEQPKAAPKARAVTAPSSVTQAQARDAAPQTASEPASAGFVGGDNMLPDSPGDTSNDSAMLGDVPQSPAFKLAHLEPIATHATTKATATTASAPRLSFKAIEPTYIQIKDPNQVEGRTVLISRVLNAGETYVPPDRADLVMQIGNAGGLQVEVDGRVLGVMGKNGEVIARLPLKSSTFLEHFAAAH
jgi:cytoskeleton protein RodZ